MRTGSKFLSLVMMAVLGFGGVCAASASAPRQRKARKPELAPLPSGPLGPIPQLPLDTVPAVAPQVSYRDGQLTILAPNSTLADILRGVHKQTGAEMEIPASANERVVTQLGPGRARDVVAELLNGSKFNYVLVGSPTDTNALTHVVLIAKTGAEPPGQNPQAPPPGQAQAEAQAQQDGGDAQEAQDAEAAEEPAPEENTDQSAEAEQPAQPPEQPGVKTPQQMLQEMQQRQLQMQQQQQVPGSPIPGGVYPQQPPPPQQQ